MVANTPPDMFLDIENMIRNKQCSVMLKRQMVRKYCSRIKVQQLFAIIFMLLTLNSFLELLRHSTRVS